MPPRKKKIRGLDKHNSEEHEEAASLKEKAKRFAFSVIFTGVGFTAACILFLFNGIDPPSETLYYQVQKEVVKVLYDMARESVQNEFNKIVPGSNISVDGSWTHRRNSRTFILDVMDVATKKIVDFELVDKGTKKLPGNYEGPSNLMEAFAFNKTILRLMKNTNISGLIKDGDTKLEKIIKDHNWNVTIYLDPNHLKKNFPKLFKQFNKLANGSLTGLEHKILTHINAVLYSNATSDEKREMFMNAFYHFLGNHTNCPEHKDTKTWKYANDPKKRDILFQLLNETANLFGDFDPTKTTNGNEYFHTLKGYVLPKINHWESSWVGRISMAILKHNRGYDWVNEAIYRLNLKSGPLHTWVQLFRLLNNRIAKANKQRKQKQTKSAKEEKRKQELQAIKDANTKTELSHS